MKCLLVDLRKEMIGLCSKESPYKYRPSSPSALVDLTTEDICMDWSARAPIFYAFLVKAGVAARPADGASVKTLPSIAVCCSGNDVRK